MFYPKGQYLISDLEKLTLDDWNKLTNKQKSDIKLSLNSSIVYEKGFAKIRLLEIKSKLNAFSMK